MKITVDEKASSLSIEVSQVKEQRSHLIATFQSCQQGGCDCPAKLPQSLDSLEVEPIDDGIKLQLHAKEGAVINRSEIEACLRFTLERAN